MAAAWSGASAGAIGVVTVTDASADAASGGERLHTCEVDASGRVLAIRHPGA